MDGATEPRDLGELGGVRAHRGPARRRRLPPEDHGAAEYRRAAADPRRRHHQAVRGHSLSIKPRNRPQRRLQPADQVQRPPELFNRGFWFRTSLARVSIRHAPGRPLAQRRQHRLGEGKMGLHQSSQNVQVMGFSNVRSGLDQKAP